MTPVQRHDEFQDTRPGEVYYSYWDGQFHVLKRGTDWNIAARYADTSVESYAKDITQLFKKYEEV